MAQYTSSTRYSANGTNSVIVLWGSEPCMWLVDEDEDGREEDTAGRAISSLWPGRENRWIVHHSGSGARDKEKLRRKSTRIKGMSISTRLAHKWFNKAPTIISALLASCLTRRLQAHRAVHTSSKPLPALITSIAIYQMPPTRGRQRAMEPS